MCYRDSNSFFVPQFYSKETSLILLQQKWCKKQLCERTRPIEAQGLLQLQTVNHRRYQVVIARDLDHCILSWYFDDLGRQNSLFPNFSLSNQHKWFPFLQKDSHKTLQPSCLSNKSEDSLFAKTSCRNTSTWVAKEIPHLTVMRVHTLISITILVCF